MLALMAAVPYIQVEGWLGIVLGAGLIFLLRVTDMAIDSLRVLNMVKGHKGRAALAGFCEALVFIYALTQVLQPPMHWAHMLGYAAGFAGGTFVGTAVAGKFMSRFMLLRILSREHADPIAERLRDADYRVTSMQGQGRYGPVQILFSLMLRKNAQKALSIVQDIDPDCFVVIENVDRAVGGFIPYNVGWRPSVRR
jgi:uncharacterized protein YebE (UPF0316 family)